MIDQKKRHSPESDLETGQQSSEGGNEDSKWLSSLAIKQIVYSICSLLFLVLIFFDYYKPGGIAQGLQPPLLTLLFLLAIPFLFPYSQEMLDNIKNEEKLSQQKSKKSPEGQEKAKVKTTRFYFLDAVKVLLTVLVVALHSIQACWDSSPYLGGSHAFPGEVFLPPVLKPINYTSIVISAKTVTNLNLGRSIVVSTISLSYAMPLFFFISGYNVPRSLERKGVFFFIRDKMKRIGLPLFFIYFLWVPVYSWTLKPFFSKVYGIDTSNIDDSYITGVSVAWFLMILIILCITYVLLHKMVKHIKVSMPSFGIALIFGMFIGVFELLSWWVPLSNTPESFPHKIFSVAQGYDEGGWLYDFLFFYFGCIAGQNNWVEDLKQKQKDIKFRLPIYITSALGMILSIVLQCVTDGKEISATASFFLNLAYKTFLTIPCSYAILLFFSVHFDKSTPFLRFTSAAAYGVYIVQWNFAYWLALIYAAMTQSVWQARIEEVSKGVISVSDYNQWAASFIGWMWLWSCGMTLLVAFPLMYYVRKLPGFRNVL